MLDTTTYLPKLKQFEGVASYMYDDTAGNVTVGVGNMLPSVAAAQKLAFVRRPDIAAKPPVLAGPASPDEIKTDFDNVNKQPAGKLVTYYKQFTKLDLPETVIDNGAELLPEIVRRDIRVDVVTDQTSAHDPLSYVSRLQHLSE